MISKSELHEMFRGDLVEVARKLNILRYCAINDMPVNNKTIRKADALLTWRDRMIAQPASCPVSTVGGTATAAR